MCVAFMVTAHFSARDIALLSLVGGVYCTVGPYGRVEFLYVNSQKILGGHMCLLYKFQNTYRTVCTINKKLNTCYWHCYWHVDIKQ